MERQTFANNWRCSAEERQVWNKERKEKTERKHIKRDTVREEKEQRSASSCLACCCAVLAATPEVSPLCRIYEWKPDLLCVLFMTSSVSCHFQLLTPCCYLKELSPHRAVSLSEYLKAHLPLSIVPGNVYQSPPSDLICTRVDSRGWGGPIIIHTYVVFVILYLVWSCNDQALAIGLFNFPQKHDVWRGLCPSTMQTLPEWSALHHVEGLADYLDIAVVLIMESPFSCSFLAMMWCTHRVELRLSSHVNKWHCEDIILLDYASLW